MSEQSRELTFGEKACGFNFNPGGLEIVTQLKAMYAAQVDALNNLRNKSDNPEV